MRMALSSVAVPRPLPMPAELSPEARFEAWRKTSLYLKGVYSRKALLTVWLTAFSQGCQVGAERQRERDVEIVAIVMHRPKTLGKRTPPPVSIETVIDALRTTPLVQAPG